MKSIIKTYLNLAPENSGITILSNRSDNKFEFIKKNIDYRFNRDKILVISDKAKKALFVLDIDYIVGVKIDYPKFNFISEYDCGENKIKV